MALLFKSHNLCEILKSLILAFGPLGNEAVKSLTIIWPAIRQSEDHVSLRKNWICIINVMSWCITLRNIIQLSNQIRKIKKKSPTPQHADSVVDLESLQSRHNMCKRPMHLPTFILMHGVNQRWEVTKYKYFVSILKYNFKVSEVYEYLFFWQMFTFNPYIIKQISVLSATFMLGSYSGQEGVELSVSCGCRTLESS